MYTKPIQNITELYAKNNLPFTYKVQFCNLNIIAQRVPVKLYEQLISSCNK